MRWTALGKSQLLILHPDPGKAKKYKTNKHSLLASNLEDDDLTLNKCKVERSLLDLAGGERAENRGLLDNVLVVRVLVVVLLRDDGRVLRVLLHVLVVRLAHHVLEVRVLVVRLKGRRGDGVVGNLDDRAAVLGAELLAEGGVGDLKVAADVEGNGLSGEEGEGLEDC
jgi:hypothetical protein